MWCCSPTTQAATLQLQLDALAQFCTDWDMAVNLAKSRWWSSTLPGGCRAPPHLAVPGAAGGASHSVQVLGACLRCRQAKASVQHLSIMAAGRSRAPGAGRWALGAGRWALRKACAPAATSTTPPFGSTSSTYGNNWCCQQCSAMVVRSIRGAQHQHFTEPSYFTDNPPRRAWRCTWTSCAGKRAPPAPRRTNVSSFRLPTGCRCCSTGCSGRCSCGTS
jgi:hypothetical protein